MSARDPIVIASRREFVRVARSFWLIPEIIPAQARDDVALLYCLCRRLDDAVDEAADAAQAALALRQLRDELEGRAPPRPLVAAFLESAARNALPLACLGSLLDGLQSDLGVVRVADDEELLRYAYRVSASVGLLLAPLLGVRGAEAGARIIDLGLALQITNVILGVGEDLARGRVYLPASRLAGAGLPLEPRRLLPVLRGLAALADRYYDSAAAGATLVPLRYRHGVLLLARAYRELGHRAARGAPPLETPGQLPLAVKARHLAALLAVALHPRTLGVVPPPPHDPSLHRALEGAFLSPTRRPDASSPC